MAGIVYEQRGSEILRQGYLTKSPPLEKGSAFKKWQRRWVIFRSDDGALNVQYYKTEADSAGVPLGTVMLDTCTAIQRDMKHSHYKNIFSINTPEREYFFSADSKHEMDEWVQALTSTMGFMTGAPGDSRSLPKTTSMPSNVVDPHLRRQASMNATGFAQTHARPRGTTPPAVPPTAPPATSPISVPMAAALPPPPPPVTSPSMASSPPGYYLPGQEVGRGALARDRNTLPTECGAEKSLTIDKRHVVGNIVYAEVVGSIWIVGWSKKDPYLHGQFQVGDQILSINHSVVRTLSEAQRAVEYCPGSSIEYVIRRTPYGLEVQLQKRSISEPLGLGLDKAKVISVTSGGIASQCGLSGQAVGLNGKGVPWVVTAINRRPVPITSVSTEDVMKRMHAAGLDVVLTLHPHDFIALLKKRLKSVRHWQDYLAK